MIPRATLEALARARLDEAEILFNANRYDSAVYICGYAVEVALKARICRTLDWPDFPETRGEFQGLQSFRTHDLNILLRLSGIATQIRAGYVPEWSEVAAWQPEIRYRAVGTTTQRSARDMLDAVRTLLGVIL
jgi:hypothetical protein